MTRDGAIVGAKALVSVKLAENVQRVFFEFGPVAAVLALIFTMAAIEVGKGWIKHLRK